jgi:HK97 family phage major capsid protein
MNSVELAKEKESLVNEAKELNKVLSQRSFSEDEQSRFDELTDRVEDISLQIKNCEKTEWVEAKERELKQVNERKISAVHSVAPKSRSYREVNDMLKAMSLNAIGKSPSSRMRDIAGDLGVNISSRSLSTRAITVGTASAGGNLVGKSFDSELRETLKYYFPIGDAVAQLNTEKGDDYGISLESDIANDAVIVGEGATISNTGDPTFSRVTMKAWKYVPKNIVRLSAEIVEDADFDLYAYLKKAFGKRFGRAYEAAVISANAGSAAPMGLLYGAPVGVNLASGNALTWQKLIDTQCSLEIEYAKRAKWIFNQNTWANVRKLADSNNSPIFNTDLQGNVVPQLLGSPVFISNALTATLASPGDNAVLGVYGDYEEYYTWRTVGNGSEVRILDQLYAQTGEIGYTMHQRADGRITGPSTAICTLNSFDAP